MRPVREFLARLVRLDPRALVRVRPDGLWAMLPFKVLVRLPLSEPPAGDATYRAADLAQLTVTEPIEAAEKLDRCDSDWRWPRPTSWGQGVETIPVADLRRLADAAARTVRTATTEGVGGRAVGERILRDALLDHVAIVVTTDRDERIEIPQRMVQALVRMGLHGPVTGDTIGDGQVTVRLAIRWIGLETRYGSAWYRPISPLRLA